MIGISIQPEVQSLVRGGNSGSQAATLVIRAIAFLDFRL